MRRLIYSINMTIDGCCDHRKVDGSEEIHEFFTRLLQTADTLIYGRVTYELMVPFWPDIAKNPTGQPKSVIDFAETFDSLDKVVFSRSLKSVDDRKSRLVGTDPAEEIKRLKNLPGGDMLLGGVVFPSYLMQLGLVDEYLFVVHPMLVGDGKRLLEGASVQEKLQLVDSKALKSGCLALRYVKP